jgi:hypothetical protein
MFQCRIPFTWRQFVGSNDSRTPVDVPLVNMAHYPQRYMVPEVQPGWTLVRIEVQNKQSDLHNGIIWLSLPTKEGILRKEYIFADLKGVETSSGSQYDVLSRVSLVSDHCMVCANPTRLVCKGCRLVKFCCKECAKKGWKYHKKFCKEIGHPR